MPCLGVNCYRYQTTPGSSSFRVVIRQQPPPGRKSISQKILAPLDGSAETEGVLPLVRDLMTPESEVILFQVIPPSKSQVWASMQEQEERGNGIPQTGHQPTTGRWRCEVAVSGSVAKGIVGFAVREGVDLIGMYTHDRKGLAKLIRGSIAGKMRRRAPVEVQVFRPRELVAR